MRVPGTTCFTDCQLTTEAIGNKLKTVLVKREFELSEWQKIESNFGHDSGKIELPESELVGVCHISIVANLQRM